MNWRGDFLLAGVVIVLPLLLVLGLNADRQQKSQETTVTVATSVGPSLAAFDAAVRRVPQHRATFNAPTDKKLTQTRDRLALAARRLGVTPGEPLFEDGEYGRITYADRKMSLNIGLKDDGRTLVMAHELAHILQPRLEVHGDEEMFAEAVAYMVTAREADYGTALAEYAARFKTSLPVLSLYEKEIVFAADFLWGVK